jgi:hypothetical protein
MPIRKTPFSEEELKERENERKRIEAEDLKRHKKGARKFKITPERYGEFESYYDIANMSYEYPSLDVYIKDQLNKTDEEKQEDYRRRQRNRDNMLKSLEESNKLSSDDIRKMHEQWKRKILERDTIAHKEEKARLKRTISPKLFESLKNKFWENHKDGIGDDDDIYYFMIDELKAGANNKSTHDLLKEAYEDKFISKKEYDILKDEPPSKIKSRLKSLEIEDFSEDEEPVVRATIDKDQYKAKPKPRKKQVAVKEIGHELHTRTHKMKKEPISKEEILNYVKMF